MQCKKFESTKLGCGGYFCGLQCMANAPSRPDRSLFTRASPAMRFRVGLTVCESRDAADHDTRDVMAELGDFNLQL